MVQKSQVVRLAEEKVDFIDYFNKYVVGEYEVQGHKQRIMPIKIGGASICPLHAETDASFKVYQKNGLTLFHCFGCGAGGTVVDLYRRIEAQRGSRGLSKDDSAATLLKLYGYQEVIEEAIKEVDPLQTALDRVKGYATVKINQTFHLGVFKRENNKIVAMQEEQSVQDSAVSLDVLVRKYAEVDKMAAAYIMVQNDNQQE